MLDSAELLPWGAASPRCSLRDGSRRRRPSHRSFRSRRPLSLARLAVAYRRSEAHPLDVPQGCSPDDAACEGLFGRLRTEMFYLRDWKSTTAEQFIEVVDSYIHWYTEKRIKVSLGSRGPIEYRISLGLAIQNQSTFLSAPRVRFCCPAAGKTTRWGRAKTPLANAIDLYDLIIDSSRI